ncbi:MAG: hypothetical protein QX199_02125 [Methylococcaceae bacterium]
MRLLRLANANKASEPDVPALEIIDNPEVDLNSFRETAAGL